MKNRNLSRAAYRAALFGWSAIAGVGMATVAQAQTAVDEIVVTAQKREQSLQEVPVAVTALSSETLQANRIANVSDLGAMAPNLTARVVAGGIGIPQFSMRGVVSYGSVAGQDKSVPIYLDGVYFGAAYGTIFDLPDLERIEVLRGPQGTLFGRNATAGAINVITQDPSGEFGFRQQLSFGNYEAIRTSTRVETPTWGPFSASLSYTHDERDGDIDNLGAGQLWDRSGPETGLGFQRSPRTLGAKDSDNWFAAIRFEATPDLDFVYKYDETTAENTPNGTAIVGVNPSALDVNLGPLGVYQLGAPIAAALATNNFTLGGPRRPDSVNNNWTVPSELRVEGHNLTVNWQINDAWSFRNILSYRESSSFAASQISGLGGLVVTQEVADALEQLTADLIDLGNQPIPNPQGTTPAFFFDGAYDAYIGDPFVITDSAPIGTIEQWSEELQFNYTSDFLTLTAGANYFEMDAFNGAPRGLGGVTTLAIVPDGVLANAVAFLGGVPGQNYSLNHNESLAAYVQGEFHVSPQLDIVAGYRITQDKKTGTTFSTAGLANFPGRVTTAIPLDYEKTQPSYSLGFNYSPTDDILFYAKYSTGFVSGGAVGTVAYEPEEVVAYEAGLKSDWFDNRLRFNLALFRADYENIQSVDTGQNINHPELGTVVVSQGDMETQGVEVELTAVPLDGLTLNAGVGFTDVEFTSVSPIYSSTACGSPPCFIPTQRPEWTSNVSAQYVTQPLFADARMMFRVDGAWRDEAATIGRLPIAPISASTAVIPAYWLVNARIALQDLPVAGGRGEIALWGRNLTDEDHAQFPIAFGANPYIQTTDYIEARTYGIELTFQY